MSPAFDLLVVGELNVDVILAGGDVTPRFGEAEQLVERGALTLGASGAILACGAARLGLRVAYAGCVGDDAAGRFVLDRLTERGVDVQACRLDATRPTGLTVVLSGAGDRAILTAPGTIPVLRGQDVPGALLGDARHVHVSAYYLQAALRPAVPGLFAQARRTGATTSLDTNGDPSGRWADGLDAALAETDVFLPNAAEATAIAGEDDPHRALDVLAARVPTVAVKRGAEGAIARRGDERAAVSAAPVVPVDTTGAGDSFGAGFLRGLLDGASLASALALAVACGTAATSALGGVDGQPTLDEALAASGSHPPPTEAHHG